MKKTIKFNVCPEEQGWNKNTEWCVDVKTYLRGDARMKKDKGYQGVLNRDGEDHMTFVESVSQKKMKRNPHVYEGEFITITRRDDGTYQPNFRPIRTTTGFDVERYVSQVRNELLWGLDGLVENGNNK